MKHKERDEETLYMIRKYSANIFTDVVPRHLVLNSVTVMQAL